ncbi:NUMOD4 motif-containing protein [Chishuiella changwenlii]|jgi:hypothetical protein|uniref:NUMOD4 motif-containing protein n=1 Tax=Chishuiella changwenlii TaxID=1434701 RepID=A0A1M6U084_9FLAO|nr:hypothetical protein [Chishuiella changwenlii]GGF08562.1 hypothetical protein GCM10010984_27130 [Chishuiella changwenlii]SHK62616.1 NUMOD4 motif-containing protein [Chishuiella changwenlii]
MVKILVGEEYRRINLKGDLRNNYAISNFGNLVSFTSCIEENGKLLKGSYVNGYRILRYSYRDENGEKKYSQNLIYHLVAEQFLPPPTEDQTYLLHVNHVKDYDHVDNLKWATKDEFRDHFMSSPLYEEGKKKSRETRQKMDGTKLTTTDVIRIKKMIANPNRKTRLKLIAKQFGISEMQLYRIKSGENWGHLKID